MTTVILFWVRVPVLSEQMMLTDPSVSTAGNFLIIAGTYGELKINMTDQTYRYELTHAAGHDTLTPGSGAGVEKDDAESFALFANAQVLGKHAACLLTISDSFVAPEITTAEQRQTSFTNMMKVALGAEY